MLPINDDLRHRSPMRTFIGLPVAFYPDKNNLCVTCRKDKRSAGVQRESIDRSMSMGWTKLRSRFPLRRLAFIL
jgi:hypothetical protein